MFSFKNYDYLLKIPHSIIFFNLYKIKNKFFIYKNQNKL